MKLTEALAQYCQIRQEVADLRRRIDRDQERLRCIEEEGVVSDTVRGTRRDGTIGPIKITGYPVPEHMKVKTMIKRRVEKLKIREDDLSEALAMVDDFIARIPKSEIRQIYQMYYLDDMKWFQVANTMNMRYPKKKTPYTADSCRMKHNRYLEKENEKK